MPKPLKTIAEFLTILNTQALNERVKEFRLVEKRTWHIDGDASNYENWRNGDLIVYRDGVWRSLGTIYFDGESDRIDAWSPNQNLPYHLFASVKILTDVRVLDATP